MPWESDKVEGIISMPNHATAPATGHKGLADQVLLERDGDGWQCVGHYIDNSIIVFRRVQNTGLADILFLRCIGICRKFRVRAITMKKKETSYGETEATGYFRRAA